MFPTALSVQTEGSAPLGAAVFSVTLQGKVTKDVPAANSKINWI